MLTLVWQDCLSCPESRPPDFASRQGKSSKTTFLKQLYAWFAFMHVHNSMDSVHHSKVRVALEAHVGIRAKGKFGRSAVSHLEPKFGASGE